MSAATICAAAPGEGSTLWIQWTLSRPGRPTVLSFTGDLHTGNANDLDSTLRTAMRDGTQMLIFDLTSVTFVDEAGVLAVERARRDAAGSSVQLDIACASLTSVVDHPGPGPGRVHATLAEALEAQRW